MARTIGILTGGGDCPGLNAVIRATTRRSLLRGDEVIGIIGGWRGMIDGRFLPLDGRSITGLLPRGGTILRSTGANPWHIEGGIESFREHVRDFDAIVAIGGEYTLEVALRLHQEEGIPVVGVPKTIDNDISATDTTFGFDTAVSIVTEAIDRLHTTAESHNRVMVVEVMGRDTGWIATVAGMAGGADMILIPEHPITIERCCELITGRSRRGLDFSIVVVAEGYQMAHDDGTLEDPSVIEGSRDAFGYVRLGGIGARVSAEIERRTGFETRVTVLGHVQRGGTPTAYDRVLATRLGLFAADMVEREEWGQMAAVRGTEIVSVSLAEACVDKKPVPRDLFDLAETFFG